MVETAYDAIFFKDLNSRYIIANNKTLEAFGLSHQQVIGKNDYEIMADKEQARENIEDDNLVFKTGKPTEVTKQMTGADGREHWFQAIKVPRFDNKGRIIGLVGIARDITQRKKVEETLRQSEERFRKFFESAPEYCYMISPEGVILDVNNSALKVLGYKKGELVGKPLETIYAPESLPKMKELFVQWKKTGRLRDEEMTIVTKKGERRAVLLSADAVKNNSGKILHSISVQRDITERKKAEEELKKEKEWAERYLNVAGVMLATVNSDENITLINKRGCEILGYKQEELIGRNWFDTLVPQRIREEVRGVFRSLMAEDIEPVEYYENPLLTKDGEEKLIAFHNTVIRDLNGHILAALTSGEDITQRRWMEKALRESENKYRILLENLPQKIFSKDKYSVYVSCNENFARDLNIKPEEITGRTDYDFFPKQLAEKYRADDKKIIESGRSEDIEEKYIQDGQETIIHTVKTPVQDEQGRVVGLLGIFWDITERKRAEGALQVAYGELERRVQERTAQLSEANRELEAEITERKQAEEVAHAARDDWENIFESISDAVLILDRDHRILDANRAAIVLLQRPKDEIIGQFCFQLFHSTKNPVDRCPHEKMLLSEYPETFDIEMEVLNGIFQVTVAPILDREGKVVKTIHIAKDITQRKRMEKTLRESEKLAAAGRLAARIAHEINNPLAAIKNSFLLIKDAVPRDHPYYQYVGRIDNEISRVSSIVRQMFDLYRPGSEPRRQFRLREVITDIVALLKVASEERNVDIQLDISGGSPVVTLDEGLFRQVLFNIIQNAIEASPPGEAVKVSAEVSDELLTVKVADQGPGIEQDIRDKVFEPFFSTKEGDATSGLGLGLSVCKGIIDATGGAISFSTEKGRGTVFNINIPLPKERREAKNG
jgi:PAS domain S-box-containing protein